MKYLLTTVLILSSLSATVFAQGKYFTRDGHVEFFSETPVENIEATNEKLTAVIDFDNGDFQFAVLIKSFEFEKALMEEHFNENYMESNKFPKATFEGTVEDFVGIRDSGFPPGVEMAARGTLTIHGVSKDVILPAIVTPNGESFKISSQFMVKPADHDIEIPGAVRDNIAESIKVTVSGELKPLKR